MRNGIGHISWFFGSKRGTTASTMSLPPGRDFNLKPGNHDMIQFAKDEVLSQVDEANYACDVSVDGHVLDLELNPWEGDELGNMSLDPLPDWPSPKHQPYHMKLLRKVEDAQRG
jgi:hypothetical protein